MYLDVQLSGGVSPMPVQSSMGVPAMSCEKRAKFSDSLVSRAVPTPAEPGAATARLTTGGPQSRPSAFDQAGFCRFVRTAFPTSPAPHLAQLTGATISTAEKWLRSETRPSAEHLGAMVSAFGPAFIAATMPATRGWSARQARHERIAEIATELGQLLAAE